MNNKEKKEEIIRELRNISRNADDCIVKCGIGGSIDRVLRIVKSLDDESHDEESAEMDDIRTIKPDESGKISICFDDEEPDDGEEEKPNDGQPCDEKDPSVPFDLFKDVPDNATDAFWNINRARRRGHALGLSECKIDEIIRKKLADYEKEEKEENAAYSKKNAIDPKKEIDTIEIETEDKGNLWDQLRLSQKTMEAVKREILNEVKEMLAESERKRESEEKEKGECAKRLAAELQKMLEDGMTKAIEGEFAKHFPPEPDCDKCPYKTVFPNIPLYPSTPLPWTTSPWTVTCSYGKADTNTSDANKNE